MSRSIRIPIRALAGLATATAALLLASAPALAAAPEAPLTITPASSITGTSARLEGTLNPHVSAKAGWYFLYNPGASCVGGIETGHEAEVSGKALTESVPLAGLEPSREYTFCMVATNEAGETTQSSNEVSFETLAEAPAILGESVPSVTPFEARLEGVVNPNNQITECHIQYGSGVVSEHETPCEPPSLEGFGEQGVGKTVTGLTPKTPYHFRVVAKNSSHEETDGTEETFETLTAEAPLVYSENAVGVTSSRAKLEATVNPNYQETEYLFEYAKSEQALLEDNGTTIAGAPPAPLLTAAFNEQIAGPGETGALEAGVTYFYRVVANNAAGVAAGPPQPFTTLPAEPTPAIGDAEGVTRNTALLTAGLDPHGGAAVYHYAYMTREAYVAALAADPGDPFALAKSTQEAKLSASNETLSVTLEAGDLAPATTYEFALVAGNPAGTVTGGPAEFTTQLATPPLASTGGAEGVGAFAATITGSVDNEGLPTALMFEFGTAPGNGALLPASVTGGSGTLQSVAITFSEGLLPGTTYYYRVIGSNADGRGEGAEQSFTTAGIPVAFPSVTLPAVIPFASMAQLEAKEPKPSVGQLPKKCPKGKKLSHGKCVKRKSKKSKKKK